MLGTVQVVLSYTHPERQVPDDSIADAVTCGEGKISRDQGVEPTAVRVNADQREKTSPVWYLKEKLKNYRVRCQRLVLEIDVKSAAKDGC